MIPAFYIEIISIFAAMSRLCREQGPFSRRQLVAVIMGGE
jgi:hypothetical protein